MSVKSIARKLFGDNFYLPISQYLRALDTEVEVSSFWGKHIGNDARLYVIPNNAALPKFLKKVLPKFYFTFPVIIPLFSFAIMLVIVVKEFITWGRKSAKKKAPQNLSVYLNASPSKVFREIDNTSENYPWCEILLPWLASEKNEPLVVSYSLQNILGYGCFVKSSFQSLILFFVVLFSKRRKSLLYCYTGFRWIYAFNGLRALSPKTIWIANHYDRWAVLVDSFDLDNRCMVQHGSLVDRSRLDGSSVSLNLDNKLTSKWNLYLYDSKEAELFKQTIFQTAPNIFEFEQKITPQIIDSAAGVSILVLGNPRLQLKLKQIILGIVNNREQEVVVYYRPHPREDVSGLREMLSKSNVHLNAEQKSVPVTDLVLTYGSSIDSLLCSLDKNIELLYWDTGELQSVTDVINKVDEIVTKSEKVLA